MVLSTVTIAGILGLVCVAFVVCLVALRMIEFRPPAELALSPMLPATLPPLLPTLPPAPPQPPAPPLSPQAAEHGGAPDSADHAETLRLVTWNLGFASLDARMDYFTDGGRRSRGIGREQTERNLREIIATLGDIDADVMFLQEVDHPSARSHSVDQVTALVEAFPDHRAYFAANLVSPYIPVPVRRPIGPVHSGMMTLVRRSFPVGNGNGNGNGDAVRVALPGVYPFPKRVFHVKRCFIEVWVRWGERDLALINLHHSAYDTGGTFRAVQTAAVLRRMRDLETAGAIAIAGGDWNGIFPEVTFNRFAPWTTDPRNLEWLQRIETSDTPESWRWLCDPATPTVRTNDRPYIPGETYRTVIDGFLATAAIGTTKTRGIDTEFGPSDHQPVVLEVGRT